MNHVSHEQSIEALIHATDISPWSSKMLFLQNTKEQRQLASVSSLRHVPVAYGLKQVMAELHVMGVLNGAADRNTFVNIVGSLPLKTCGYVKAHEHLNSVFDSVFDSMICEHLNSVFDSMTFDEPDMLSLGEWSVGLSVFLEGTEEEKTQALFELLDQDSDGCLSKKELKEYMAPLVKSMIPSEAIPMQPTLLELCASQMMQSLSVKVDGKVSRQQFLQFHSEHHIVDSLFDMIDSNVYQMWLRKNGICQGESEDEDCCKPPVLHSQVRTEKIHCGLCHRRVLPDPSAPHLCTLCQHHGRTDKMGAGEVQRLVVDESKPSEQPPLSDTASTVDTDEVGSEKDDEELWMPPRVNDWYLEQAKVFKHVSTPVSTPVEDKWISL